MKRLTRVKAIRARCLDCSDGQADVRACPFPECPLYHYRMGRKGAGAGKIPSIAIRDYCTECCNGQPRERTKCPAVKCPVWRYRNGREESIPAEAQKGGVCSQEKGITTRLGINP